MAKSANTKIKPSDETSNDNVIDTTISAIENNIFSPSEAAKKIAAYAHQICQFQNFVALYSNLPPFNCDNKQFFDNFEKHSKEIEEDYFVKFDPIHRKKLQVLHDLFKIRMLINKAKYLHYRALQNRPNDQNSLLESIELNIKILETVTSNNIKLYSSINELNNDDIFLFNDKEYIFDYFLIHKTDIYKIILLLNDFIHKYKNSNKNPQISEKVSQIENFFNSTKLESHYKQYLEFLSSISQLRTFLEAKQFEKAIINAKFIASYLKEHQHKDIRKQDHDHSHLYTNIASAYFYKYIEEFREKTKNAAYDFRNKNLKLIEVKSKLNDSGTKTYLEQFIAKITDTERKRWFDYLKEASDNLKNASDSLSYHLELSEQSQIIHHLPKAFFTNGLETTKMINNLSVILYKNALFYKDQISVIEYRDLLTLSYENILRCIKLFNSFKPYCKEFKFEYTLKYEYNPEKLITLAPSDIETFTLSYEDFEAYIKQFSGILLTSLKDANQKIKDNERKAKELYQLQKQYEDNFPQLLKSFSEKQRKLITTIREAKKIITAKYLEVNKEKLNPSTDIEKDEVGYYGTGLAFCNTTPLNIKNDPETALTSFLTAHEKAKQELNYEIIVRSSFYIIECYIIIAKQAFKKRDFDKYCSSYNNASAYYQIIVKYIAETKKNSKEFDDLKNYIESLVFTFDILTSMKNEDLEQLRSEYQSRMDDRNAFIYKLGEQEFDNSPNIEELRNLRTEQQEEIIKKLGYAKWKTLKKRDAPVSKPSQILQKIIIGTEKVASVKVPKEQDPSLLKTTHKEILELLSKEDNMISVQVDEYVESANHLGIDGNTQTSRVKQLIRTTEDLCI